MKKFLCLILILALVLTGVFLWKGGHHALFLMDKLEDWLDADTSDQYISLTMNDVSLSGETFWTERDGGRVYGLDHDGFGVYLRSGVLYMDTGRAYSLPEFSTDPALVRRLLLGALLHGRITKEDGSYIASMETAELTFRAQIRANTELEAVELDAAFSEVTVSASVTRSPARSHTIPQAVVDAMVRADMEPPMSLTEPLDTLLPALEGLRSLQADVTLGVECGILSISDTVSLYVENGTAELERGGKRVPLTLPGGLPEISPVTAGLLLLRHGEFVQTSGEAQFLVTLDAQTTAQLCEALVPQIGELGITFETGEAVLTIRDEALASVSMTASGSVPFLVTTIPLSFSAKFDMQ